MGEVVSSEGVARSKRWIKVTVGVLFVAGLLATVMYGANEALKKPAIEIGSGEGVSARVSIMPQRELGQVSKVVILDPDKDIDWAYAKATALTTLGKHQESLKVYESLTKTDRAPYYIYVDYALAASRAGDKTLAIQAMTEAIAKLDADTSVASTGKERTKKQLASKLDAFKEAAK